MENKNFRYESNVSHVQKSVEHSDFDTDNIREDFFSAFDSEYFNDSTDKTQPIGESIDTKFSLKNLFRNFTGKGK